MIFLGSANLHDRPGMTEDSHVPIRPSGVYDIAPALRVESGNYILNQFCTFQSLFTPVDNRPSPGERKRSPNFMDGWIPQGGPVREQVDSITTPRANKGLGVTQHHNKKAG